MIKLLDALTFKEQGELLDLFLSQGTPASRGRDMKNTAKRIYTPQKVLDMKKWPKRGDVYGIDTSPITKSERKPTEYNLFTKEMFATAKAEGRKIDMNDVSIAWRDKKIKENS